MMKSLSKRREHVEKLNFEKIQFLGFISFLLGFSGALLSYIASTYFKEATGTENVGIFFLFAYSIVLIILLNLHKIVKLVGKVSVFYVVFILRATVIAFLFFLPPSHLSVALLVVYIILEVLGWVNLDVILESFSTDRMSGRIRGLHLTIINSGFILGPFLSTRILDDFGYKGVFAAVFVVHFIVFSIVLLGLRGINHTFHRKETTLQLLKRAWKRKNILRIYYISSILEFFYASMVIYSPLYLLDRGFSWDQIGIAFSIMLIPFVITQYPTGIIADRKTGEKEFLVAAIFIMGFSVLAFYFADSRNIFVWAAILFMTRMGASLVEILRDSYFYKRIDSSDVDLIDFFRTSRPMGYILATISASLIMLNFPIRYVFIFLVLVIFSALYPIFRLVDNKSECDREKDVVCKID